MEKLRAPDQFLPGQKPEKSTGQGGWQLAPFCFSSFTINPPVPFCSQSVGSKCFFNRGVEQAHAGVT